MPRRHIALACACSVAVAITAARVSSGEHPIWDPGLEQAATGRLGRGSPPKSVADLEASVRRYLSLTDEELRQQISTEKGGASSEEAIRERAQATYNLALLHHLTQRTSSDEADYARRSAILLARYAEVFPSWKYEVCHGSCGLWTDWYHADFETSMNLALA